MQIAHDILEKLAVDPKFASYRFPWSETRKRFTLQTASSFFIGVMLDQGQQAERSSEGANHFVETYFPEESIWEDIAATHLNRLTSICQKGWDGTSYALHYNYSKFPKALKENAKIIVKNYASDPRNIWNVAPNDVEQIYIRFNKFVLIGDALAKMAQFALVRKGIAGGIQSKQYLKAKPDIHVSKVLYRMSLSENESPKSAIRCIEMAEVSSQADLDAVLFNVGRDFCFKNKPLCDECILNTCCKKNF